MQPVHSLPECKPWKSRSELATKFFGAQGNERHRDIEGIREIGVLYSLAHSPFWPAGLVLLLAFLE